MQSCGHPREMQGRRHTRTYLDAAAAAPVSRAARAAFLRALPYSGNPSSPHEEGRKARTILEDARVRIARLASVKAEAVIFTSGATEANTLAIVGGVRAQAPGTRPHVLYLPGAHASVRGALSLIAEEIDAEPLPLTHGLVDLDRLRACLHPETALIILDVVESETGIRHDVRAVRRVLDAARKNGPRIRIHADASQAPLVESIALTRLGADTLALDAQKIGGVRGVGALIAPRQVQLSALMEGGGQERGLRPGTEPVALVAAFATALEEADTHRSSFVATATRLRSELLAALVRDIPTLLINDAATQAPHIVNLSFPGLDTDYLVALLDEAGYAVSTRSACETNETGSRAVLALTGDEARAASTLRISFGPSTTVRELRSFAHALIRAVRFMEASTVY